MVSASENSPTRGRSGVIEELIRRLAARQTGEHGSPVHGRERER
ncbi:MAG TPA: hypothetical protein PLP82_02575 [Deltaproteobacteria bacterium]|nr:hypothetical protein [Deltaproteobacteria bacterium]HRW80157.1 hypothetical protein [Desulfomonilia bacterium]HNS88893.1 hypothetical protein [Deltaproteobacteria bacterium]HOC74845.1 hypothetical protein [Deltaproteobacteria bacterium]HON95086.1 hypothetical protein [Deltaproteobacteria bacterium]